MQTKNKTIKFIDLFAGIGGFHIAIKQTAKKLGLKAKCVFVSEIDKRCIEVYRQNFNYKDKIWDIKELDDHSSQVPDHDLLMAGFPCQPFSKAGKRLGFEDENRGNFFFDILKIIENKRPKFILLENVASLVNHDDGYSYERMIEELVMLGYVLPKKPLILNPTDFGIPQDRKRLYIPALRWEKTKAEYKDIEEIWKAMINFCSKITQERSSNGKKAVLR